MPTPNTEAPVAQSETLEQIAERVVDENLDTYHYSTSRRDLIAAILSALRNEREACAKIADAVEGKWIEDARNVARADDLVGSLAQSTYNNYAEIAHDIARAIREGR